jgi:hypothetical protein
MKHLKNFNELNEGIIPDLFNKISHKYRNLVRSKEDIIGIDIINCIKSKDSNVKILSKNSPEPKREGQPYICDLDVEITKSVGEDKKSAIESAKLLHIKARRINYEDSMSTSYSFNITIDNKEQIRFNCKEEIEEEIFDLLYSHSKQI